MTVYNTAYNTTACNNFRMEKAVSAVQEAQIRDYMSDRDGVMYVDSNHGAQGVVPAFKHALYVSKHASSDIRHAPDARNAAFLAMDVRAAGRYDVEKGRFKVTNGTMYKNLVYRAALTSLWLTNGPNVFRNVTPTALSIFAAWVSEAVGFRYNLDPKARIDVMVIAGIFYQSNHVEGIEFDNANENRYIALIGNALKVNVTEVMKIYNITKAISSIEDFCNKVKLYLNNVRLENLNAGMLVAMMGSTWAGDNAPELVAVALEHPPTWLSLLYEAHTNMALKKVGLSKICERRQYQDGLPKIELILKTSMPETVAMLQDRQSNALG
jgi:hypothetical protein